VSVPVPVAARASVCCEVMSLFVMNLKVETIGVSFWHQ